MPSTSSRCFELIIIGDEILSGKRQDKHLAQVVQLLASRGLNLSLAQYVGDDPQRITDTLRRAFAGSSVVFCTGGIGATPDDHTRTCAGAALGQSMVLHPQAKSLIVERMQDVAREHGLPFEPERDDNAHRLNMGVFPAQARILPNPYNKIAGFTCDGPGGATVHFVPGFPVMAWPMIEWCLDTFYADQFQVGVRVERSVIVFGAMEATLTPLMERIEREFEAIKVFSLPSVDHPTHGKHIELGVKGPVKTVELAFDALKRGLALADVRLGPEMVR